MSKGVHFERHRMSLLGEFDETQLAVDAFQHSGTDRSMKGKTLFVLDLKARWLRFERLLQNDVRHGVRWQTDGEKK